MQTIAKCCDIRDCRLIALEYLGDGCYDPDGLEYGRYAVIGYRRHKKTKDGWRLDRDKMVGVVWSGDSATTASVKASVYIAQYAHLCREVPTAEICQIVQDLERKGNV